MTQYLRSKNLRVQYAKEYRLEGYIFRSRIYLNFANTVLTLRFTIFVSRLTFYSVVL